MRATHIHINHEAKKVFVVYEFIDLNPLSLEYNYQRIDEIIAIWSEGLVSPVNHTRLFSKLLPYALLNKTEWQPGAACLAPSENVFRRGIYIGKSNNERRYCVLFMPEENEVYASVARYVNKGNIIFTHS